MPLLAVSNGKAAHFDWDSWVQAAGEASVPRAKVWLVESWRPGPLVRVPRQRTDPPFRLQGIVLD